MIYTVTTIDGYKLGLHRIPGSKGMNIVDSLKNANSKVPVIVSHGIIGSA